MGNIGDENRPFGWSDLIAAALAVGLATFAAPNPAASAEPDDGDDWNFLWLSPSPQPETNALAPLGRASSINTALSTLAPEHMADERQPYVDIPADPGSSSAFERRIEAMPVSVRFAPPVSGASIAQPSIMMREDRWTMLDMNGVARLTAYARGPLDSEDAAQARTATPYPRSLGTGFGFVTTTPVYLGATVKTDRSLYDIDKDRFDGARWTTSVFMGTETALGPLYLGTSKEADGARSAYLYLGRWF